jgi:hypothetical protein
MAALRFVAAPPPDVAIEKSRVRPVRLDSDNRESMLLD